MADTAATTTTEEVKHDVEYANEEGKENVSANSAEWRHTQMVSRQEVADERSLWLFLRDARIFFDHFAVQLSVFWHDKKTV